MAHPAPPRPARSATGPRRVLLAGSAGNFTEWYEFGVYAAFATVIADRFFTPAQAAGQGGAGPLVATYASFAVSFFFRPAGALLFGRVGDRVGRRPALVLVITLMTLATTLIGLLPDRDAIGVAAPWMLTLLRVLQGLCLGGEFGGAVALMTESAPPGRRGRHGAWQSFTVALGLLAGAAVAALLSALLPPAALHAWGWRIPFLLALPLGLAAYRLRAGLPDDPPPPALTAAPAPPEAVPPEAVPPAPGAAPRAAPRPALPPFPGAPPRTPAPQTPTGLDLPLRGNTQPALGAPLSGSRGSSSAQGAERPVPGSGAEPLGTVEGRGGAGSAQRPDPARPTGAAPPAAGAGLPGPVGSGTAVRGTGSAASGSAPAPTTPGGSGTARAVLLAVARLMGWSAAGYTFLVVLPSYLQATLGASFRQALTATALANLGFAAAILPAGILSDRIGRRPVMLAGALGVTLLALPLLHLLQDPAASAPAKAAAVLAAGATVGLLAGPGPAMLAETFPARVRCTGPGLAYALTGAVFSGCAGLVITALTAATGDHDVPAYYAAGTCALSALALAGLRGDGHLRPLE
ncbi:MFS transporter [Streptomyces sp. NBC_00158]|uniref:MFS transporter n=1 Tax=Streptomyces sp. NBC_00158 TaxID=2903627 RepID=UPI00324A7A03